MYNPDEIEPQIAEFWEQQKIYEKAKKKVEKGEKVYFLDGPPYTTGKVHVGTAWNKSLKDFYLRVMRMKGCNVWDRAGWDMHGLPVTHKVLENIGIEKHEIEEYGVEKFIKKCREFAEKNKNLMTEQFKKLGVWMDWENAYMSITPDFMEGVWWVIKQANDNGFLYQGKKTMHWCPKCATSLAKHELEYHDVSDDSVFVKLAIEGKKDEYLLIWTTTPWTIPYNLAVMVNPEIDYVKADVEVAKGKKEKWIIAKALSAVVIAGVAGKKFKIVEEFKGDKLKGLRYKPPFIDDVKFLQELREKNKKSFSVVLSEEYVNTSGGTGLVHCAPGCGPEDYEIGHREKLPAYNTLDEQGILEDVGKYSGLRARKDDKKFIAALEEKGILVASTKVGHDYAHCWRCKSAVVFRTTDQWFFNVESKLKQRMIDFNKKIKWQPDWAGDKWMASWLENLRDNGITRQIYWGTPLPIWQCEDEKCKNFEVIGSKEELEKKSGMKAPEDLHIPYIDEIKWKCKCGKMLKRLPDVVDVWLDAGATSFTCLDYPNNKELFKQYWPADIIIEGKDQIRGWFNLLFVASMVATEQPSYKSVYMHGFINDTLGRKMSKSLGNIISPEEIIEKYGIDASRLYLISASGPGLDLNYDHREAKIKYKSLTILYNIAKYLQDYSKLSGKPLFEPENLEIEEKYILSRLNSTLKKVNELFDDLQFNRIPIILEDFVLELSRFYMQLTREKISTGTEKEKATVLDTIAHCFYQILVSFAPICPFITEDIYQQFKKSFGGVRFEQESIHLVEWPKHDEKMILSDLEKQVEVAKIIIESGLAEREQTKIGLRWPLSTLEISSEDASVNQTVKNLGKIIAKQVNVQEVVLKELKDGREFKGGKMNLVIEMTPELLAEGFLREIVRRIQSLRKKAGLQKGDKIDLMIAVKDLDNLDKDKIQRLVNAEKIDIAEEKQEKFGFEEMFKVKDKEIVIGFKKV